MIARRNSPFRAKLIQTHDEPRLNPKQPGFTIVGFKPANDCAYRQKKGTLLHEKRTAILTALSYVKDEKFQITWYSLNSFSTSVPLMKSSALLTAIFSLKPSFISVSGLPSRKLIVAFRRSRIS